MEEMKVTKRQRIREIMKKPEKEAEIEATYDELEEELQKKIDGLNHQIDMLSDKRNMVIKVNRAAKTALDVFADILAKEKLDRNDLELIIDRVMVFEDHLEIKLQRDIDALLRCGTLEEAANFNSGIENSLHCRLVQSADKRPDKVFDVNVVYDGDPLEIYTSRDGEVIFKKYSLIGGLDDFAVQFCESLNKSTGCTTAITDRDSIIAVVGGERRELMGKHISPRLEEIMEERKIYRRESSEDTVLVTENNDRCCALIAAPIICEGDTLGLVLFTGGETEIAGETEYKLAQTIAAFLGKHMES